jgi:hypothetical protein
MDERPERAPAEARLRGLRLIWGAQLFTLVPLFFIAYFVQTERVAFANHTLAWTLGAVGFITFLVSFLLKRKLLAQAVEKRRADLVTTAYIVAFALCEMTALLGFVAYFITGLSYALHSFIIAAGGMLLHFPARDALEEIEAGGGGNASAYFNKTTL